MPQLNALDPPYFVPSIQALDEAQGSSFLVPAKGVQLGLNQVSREGNLGSKCRAFPTTPSRVLMYGLEHYPSGRYLKAYKLV
jgi:hypothetical protein